MSAPYGGTTVRAPCMEEREQSRKAKSTTPVFFARYNPTRGIRMRTKTHTLKKGSSARTTAVRPVTVKSFRAFRDALTQRFQAARVRAIRNARKP